MPLLAVLTKYECTVWHSYYMGNIYFSPCGDNEVYHQGTIGLDIWYNPTPISWFIDSFLHIKGEWGWISQVPVFYMINSYSSLQVANCLYDDMMEMPGVLVSFSCFEKNKNKKPLTKSKLRREGSQLHITVH